MRERENERGRRDRFIMISRHKIIVARHHTWLSYNLHKLLIVRVKSLEAVSIHRLLYGQVAEPATNSATYRVNTEQQTFE